MGATELVGRERELAAVAAALQGGASRAVLIEGEAGIGKTSVWRAAVDEARRAGMRVLRAAPGPGEQALAFAGLGDLLADVLDSVEDALPPPQRRAVAVALQLEDPAGEPPSSTAIASATLSALRAVAAIDGPVLLAVDDVQWLDASSATILAFVLRRVEPEAVAVLLAHRTGEPPGPLAAVVDARGGEVVALAGLSLGAIQRLLATRLELPASRPLLRRIHEVSGGNPFYALELGRAAARSGERTMPPVPPQLHELVAARLDALPEPTRAYLLELAAAGEPPPELLRDRRAAAAVRAGVLELAGEEPRFAHPLLRAAVYAAADPWRRREVHARLAELASSPEERARHLATVAEAPDAAAARAVAAGELYARALELVPPDDLETVAELALGAASAFNAAGDGGRAYALCHEAVARLPEGLLRAPVLVFLADNHRSNTFEIADQAVRESAGDPALLAAARNARSDLLFAFSRLEEARDEALAAAESARTGADTGALVRALTQVGYLGVLMGEPTAREALEEALELERAQGTAHLFYGPGTALAVVQIWHDELAVARATLARQAAEAAAQGDEPVRHALLVHLLKADWRAGDREALERHAETVAGIQASAGWEDRGSSGWARALAAAHAGRLDEAREHARSSLAAAEASGNHMWVLQASVVLGHVELAAGDAPAAADALAPLAARAREQSIREPGMLAYHHDELEALARSGRLEEAEQRVAAVAADAERLRRPRELLAAARGRALLLEARDDLERAAEELERALPLHERLPAPVEHGRTLLLLGSLRRRLRQRGAAREVLEDAAARLAAAGADAWAQRAREELARLGGRAPSGAALTAAEERVAALAAEGRSTKEIAAALVVSPKTVEGHLTRIYEKLGVRSRAELAARLAG